MNIFRWYPSIKVGPRGPMIRRSPLHLRQSDLDGACGPHCALMALMALGIVARQQVENLPNARNKSLSCLWSNTERKYFAGTNARELKSTLASYAEDIDAKIFLKNCVDHALDALSSSGMAIIGIKNGAFDHWVLAIGLGGSERKSGFTPSSFLILDPGYSPNPLSAWNATLSITRDSRERHLYKTRHGGMRVRIQDLIVIQKREP